MDKTNFLLVFSPRAQLGQQSQHLLQSWEISVILHFYILKNVIFAPSIN